MSALPPKADMCGAKTNVRFVPIADITSVTRLLVSSYACKRGRAGEEVFTHGREEIDHF